MKVIDFIVLIILLGPILLIKYFKHSNKEKCFNCPYRNKYKNCNNKNNC